MPRGALARYVSPTRPHRANAPPTTPPPLARKRRRASSPTPAGAQQQARVAAVATAAAATAASTAAPKLPPQPAALPRSQWRPPLTAATNATATASTTAVASATTALATAAAAVPAAIARPAGNLRPSKPAPTEHTLLRFTPPVQTPKRFAFPARCWGRAQSAQVRGEGAGVYPQYACAQRRGCVPSVRMCGCLSGQIFFEYPYSKW